MPLSIAKVLLFFTCAAAFHDHHHEYLARKTVSEFSSPNLYARSADPSVANASCAPYWMENIKHQGLASFNSNSSSAYKVFRNVKDYGAVGDGVADDTKAIQKAITEGERCAPGVCMSTTRTPAVVYFPGGTYKISEPIIDYYYTQIIGNPNCMPVIKADSKFRQITDPPTAVSLIDGDPYMPDGAQGWGSTNIFFRQIRNLVFDTTSLPPTALIQGLHWPTAQTTSLQNLVFKMSAENGTQHVGLFVENGSGGFMTDLVFEGGLYGFNVGNQQFTTRNLTFTNSVVAVNQLWDWGWTYKSVSIKDCQIGFNISVESSNGINVGSITILDSSIKNTPVGILTSRTAATKLDSAGSIYLENIRLENVETAIKTSNGTAVEGLSGSAKIEAWADGHRILPEGLVETQGTFAASNRPASLLDTKGKFYERSKPQYENLPLEHFLSARDLKVAGDGTTDDTSALNAAIQEAKDKKKILYIDAGYYKVTNTIHIPPGSRIVGEALSSVILSSGDFFSDIRQPQPVVQVGAMTEQGSVEMSDMMVSTQGAQAGAVLIEYNLFSTAEPAGLWDVHTRIGGFAGSQLQNEQCPKTPNITVTADNLNKECIAAYMSIHVTKGASGLYMENSWLWVADHDLDDTSNNNTQITIYAGRGLLVESTEGRIWLSGTAVEHHVKYQYQFVDTRDIFMGQIQTETPYYQPNPNACIPFPEDSALSDPIFTSNSSATPSRFARSTAANSTGSHNNAEAWGLRILRSSNIFVYGAGHYSFFDNYNTNCSAASFSANCQTHIVSIEGDVSSHDINMYNLNTVGATWMLSRDGKNLESSADHNNTFADTINVLRF